MSLQTQQSVSNTVTMDMVISMLKNHEGSSTSGSLLQAVDLGHRERTDSLPLSAINTLKRSHWKSTLQAVKCASSGCRKRFTNKLFEKKRNCCMCGEVFCRKCTQYRRKLSPDAQPDPAMGTFCYVCKACFDENAQEDGQESNWTPYFFWFRQKERTKEKEQNRDDELLPIPMARSKRDRINEELDRLVIGYETHQGLVKGLFSDLIKIPQWQKSPHWLNPSKAHQCQNCHISFTAQKRKKVNCRVCGQVFCPECTQDEIILFFTRNDTLAKWAVNGLSGGPERRPRRFELLPMCRVCSDQCQAIICEEINGPAEEVADAQEDFMDVLSNLNNILHRIKMRIEFMLPQYQKMVDSLDIVDGAPRSVTTCNPVNDLARFQTNLSDHFSQLAIDSQKLRHLKPVNQSQLKVLKTLSQSTAHYYQENMYVFRTTKGRLGELMPAATLHIIQEEVNKMAVERVHIFLKQITFEAMNIELSYRMVSTDIAPTLVRCTQTLEEEMEQFFTQIGKNWENHAKAVSQMLKEDYNGTNPDGKMRRRIKIRKVPQTPFRNILIQHQMLSQCSQYMDTSLRELEAKTQDSIFENTKQGIKSVREEFDRQTAFLESTHPHVFQVT